MIMIMIMIMIKTNYSEWSDFLRQLVDSQAHAIWKKTSRIVRTSGTFWSGLDFWFWKDVAYLRKKSTGPQKKTKKIFIHQIKLVHLYPKKKGTSIKNEQRVGRILWVSGITELVVAEVQ